MRSAEDQFDQWLDERIAGRASAPPSGSPLLDDAASAFTDAYDLLGSPRASFRKDHPVLSHASPGSPNLAIPTTAPPRREPLRPFRSAGTFATLAIVALVVIAGLWQAGAFRDLLPGTLGDEPLNFAAIPFLNDDDEGPDIVASPAAAGVCPPYEEIPQVTEAGSDKRIDPAGFRDLIPLCVADYTWPDGVQPDIAKIQARHADGNWVTSIIGPRSVVESLNICAWSHVWIVAMQDGDTGAAAESKPVLMDLLTALATRQTQAQYERFIEPLQADDVDTFAERSMGCYPMGWTTETIAAPAGTGTENVLPATPDATTPIATSDSGCRLGRDMPIVADGAIADPSVTYLQLTADGILKLVCGTTSTDLLTQVQGVMGLGYPGVVNVTFEPVDLDTRRQGLYNIATGDLFMYGAIPESMQYDTTHPAESPWFIAPDAADPTKWMLTDLRTFETRPLTDYVESAEAEAVRNLFTDYVPETGTLLVAQEIEAADGSRTLAGAVLDSFDSAPQQFDIPLETNYMTQRIGLDALGTTLFLYAWADPNSSDRTDTQAYVAAYGIADGDRYLYDTNAELTNQGPLLTANRTQVIFTSRNRIVSYNTAARTASDLYVAPEGDTFGELEYGPNDTTLIVTQHTPNTDPANDDDIVVAGTLLLDVNNGTTTPVEGVIIAPDTSPWTGLQRFVAVIPSPDTEPLTVTILDLETMETVGEPITIPDGADPRRLLGPAGVTATQDGSRLIVAFDPTNPTVIWATSDGVEVTPLFTPGTEPEAMDFSSIAVSGDGSWLGSWPGSEDASGALIDLSGPNVVIVEVEVTDDIDIRGFVEGVRD
jgi:hypothetical protein